MTATRLFFHAFLTLLAASMLTATAHAADSTWTLDHLMSTLTHNKSRRATFTETRALSAAAQPIGSSGELVFAAPDHLEKHTLAPKPEHLVIDGGKLTVKRSQRRFTMPLSQYPELGAFIESIRATLADNCYALEAIYKVAIADHGDDWTLTLSPIDTHVQQVVCTIALEGTCDMLHSVAIRQADDDCSLIHLQRVLSS